MRKGISHSGRLSAGMAWLSIAVLSVAGCTSQAPTKPSQATITAKNQALPSAVLASGAAVVAAGPTVIDQRPNADKVYDIHSLWITSCDYGIYTIPEKPEIKTHVEALHDDLASLPGDPWHGHQVTVTHYAAYLNAKKLLKKNTYGATLGGLIPGLIVDSAAKSTAGGESCPAAKLHGGWYLTSELTTPNPPIVIEISARVDNEVHTVRSVYSPEPAVWPKLKKPGDDAQLAKAIHQADMAFVKSLSGGSRQVSPVVGSSSAAATASDSSDADSSNLTEAQQVATKLGCGAVYSTGNNGFAAQCNSGGCGDRL